MNGAHANTPRMLSAVPSWPRVTAAARRRPYGSEQSRVYPQFWQMILHLISIVAPPHRSQGSLLSAARPAPVPARRVDWGQGTVPPAVAPWGCGSSRRCIDQPRNPQKPRSVNRS